MKHEGNNNGTRLMLIYAGFAALMFIGMIVATAFTPRYRDETVYNAEQTALYANYSTPTPIPMAAQVIVAQDIPAGFEIPEDALIVREVALEIAIRGSYADIEEVVGKVARVDIKREQVVTANMLEDAEPAPDVRATATILATTPEPVQLQVPANAPLPTATWFSYLYAVVPVYDIPAGTTITPQDVIVMPIIDSTAPINALNAVDLAVGKVTISDLPRDYPILANTLQESASATVTPVPIGDDVCMVRARSLATLYDSTDTTLFAGEMRPDTDMIAVAQEENRYRVALPGGYEIGWVNRGDVITSGNCEDFE